MNGLSMFSYLALLPVLARHPKLVQAFSENIDDAQRLFTDIEALVEKHRPLIDKVQEFIPEYQEFVSEAYPIIQNAN
jgi:t-SNARE complex subunit (syntaxin)